MKFWIIILCLFCLSSVNSHQSGATAVLENNSIKLGTFSMPPDERPIKKEVFYKVIDEIKKLTNLDIKVISLPLPRLIQEFSAGGLDGIFPVVDVISPMLVKRTYFFHFKRDFIFYRKSHAFRSLESLKGKVVGLTRNQPYSTNISTNNSFIKEFANTTNQNLKKLKSGRIDAFICEEIVALDAIKKGMFNNIEYNHKNPVSMQNVYFAFHKNKSGERLQKIFNIAIKKMIKDKTLQRILISSRSKFDDQEKSLLYSQY